MPTRAVSFQIQSGANMIQYEHFMTSSRRNEKRNVNILRHIQTKKRLKDKTKSMNIETFIKPSYYRIVNRIDSNLIVFNIKINRKELIFD